MRSLRRSSGASPRQPSVTPLTCPKSRCKAMASTTTSLPPPMPSTGMGTSMRATCLPRITPRHLCIASPKIGSSHEIRNELKSSYLRGLWIEAGDFLALPPSSQGSSLVPHATYRLIHACPVLEGEQGPGGAFDGNDAHAIVLSDKIATRGDRAFDPQDAQSLVQPRAFETLRGKPDIPGAMLEEPEPRL